MFRKKFVGLAVVGLLSVSALAVGARGAAAQSEDGGSAPVMVQDGGSSAFYPPLMRPGLPGGIWGEEFTAWPFSFRYGYGPWYGYRPWHRYWYGEENARGFRTWYGYGMPYYAYYPRPYLSTLDRSRNAPSSAMVEEPGPGDGAPTPEDVVRRVESAWKNGSVTSLAPLLSRQALVGITVAGRPAAAERLSQNEFLERMQGAFAAIRTERIAVTGLLPRGGDRLEGTAVHDYRRTRSTSLASQAEPPASATLTVTTTRRGGRWFLTAIAVPPGHPLVAAPVVIASR